MNSSTKIGLVTLLLIFGIAGAYYAFVGGGPNPADGGSTESKAPSVPNVERSNPSANERNRPNHNPSMRPEPGPKTESDRESQPTFTMDPLQKPAGPQPIEPSPDLTNPGYTLPAVDPGTEPEDSGGKGDGIPASAPAESTNSSNESPATGTAPGEKPTETKPSSRPSTDSDSNGKPESDPTDRPIKPNVSPATDNPRNSPTRPPEYTEYAVKSGDTMSSIAEDWFGDVNKWDLISKANPMVDPQHLKIGQVLRLPPKTAQREPVTPRPASGDVVYTVRPGDNLSRIAEAYYGDISKWSLIYEANRAVIGDDAAALKVGMKLTIPPAPGSTKK